METDELVRDISINNPEIKELIDKAYEKVKAMDKKNNIIHERIN